MLCLKFALTVYFLFFYLTICLKCLDITDINLLYCSLSAPSSSTNGGGSSSVGRDLAWEPEGRRFKSRPRPISTECGLVAGEVPVHLLGTAEVPLSKAPNPQLLGALDYVAAPSL